MFECTTAEDLGVTWVAVTGRIDSMSAPELQRQISDLILNGVRTLVLNLEEVNYISSVGLRVVLSAQKQLTKAGGEIILYRIAREVFPVFKQSGFLQIFRSAPTKEALASLLNKEAPAAFSVARELDGISLQYIEKQAEPSLLRVIGSQEKLARCQYRETDVVSVKAQELQFGTGLASLGESYAEYKNFFGETMIINRHFFFYPAVKRPAVDVMLGTDTGSSLEYRFLHGFGFNGAYNYIISFEGAAGFIGLPQLVTTLFSISQANLVGMVFLAESKGLWGMHLKQVPVHENLPKNGREIFAPENFSEWVNFPVDPGDINNIVAGCGIAVRDKSREPAEIQALFAKEAAFHIHGGVFSQEPLSKNLEHFESELTRVLTELEVYKVQHLLAQTKFSGGMAGIIELTY